jgi:glutaconyl-CoA/methylmalonyl-CoA decarboxylase subunit gamma
MQELVKSPLPGRITRICVQEGDKVKKGDLLFILESMKMINEIVSTDDGVVTKIFANENTHAPMRSDVLEIEIK